MVVVDAAVAEEHDLLADQALRVIDDQRVVVAGAKNQQLARRDAVERRRHAVDEHRDIVGPRTIDDPELVRVAVARLRVGRPKSPRR